jgi:membrane-associated phospholipid phosphatase
MGGSFSAAGRFPAWRAAAVWAVAAVVLTGAVVLFADRAVSTWSHDVLHRPAWAVDITKAAKWYVPCGLAILVLAAALAEKLAGRPLGRLWRAAVAAALATLLAAVAVTFVKYGFGRLWPETWVDKNPSWIGNHAFGFAPFHGGGGYESFPSGHTARLSAPAAVLWRRIPALRVLWVLPVLAVIVGLVAADFHFLGDCVGGVFLGVLCAWSVLRTLPQGW